MEKIKNFDAMRIGMLAPLILEVNERKTEKSTKPRSISVPQINSNVYYNGGISYIRKLYNESYKSKG